MARFLIGTPIVLLLVSFLLNVVLMFAYIFTYNTLTEEIPIAKIEFKDINNTTNIHKALLKDFEDNKIGEYEIYGEQFRLDAKFMKMKYWANLFGLDSRYDLERFEGRYINTEDQNTKKTLSYDLSKDTLVDTFTFAGWNGFVDINYGSSTYTDIKNDVKFVIYRTMTGIIVREEPIKIANTKKGYFTNIIESAKKIVE